MTEYDQEPLLDVLMEDRTIQRDFEKFHKRHSWVYDELCRLARELQDRGHRHCSIGMLYEVVRWQEYRRTIDAGGFRLNNNYRSRYARLIMDREPDLAGFFEIRELRSE